MACYGESATIVVTPEAGMCTALLLSEGIVMIYRAVFCDIDGTLLASDHSLPAGTAEAVRAVSRAGVPFVLVSARSPSGVFRVQEQLGIAGPVVCYGGALILDRDRTVVHSLALDI